MTMKETRALSFFTIGILGLFLGGFFLLVILGAKSYRTTVAHQDYNNETRALSSSIINSVKASDTLEGVTVQNIDGKPVLCIADGNTGYSLYIFQEDETLLEQYAKVGTGLSKDMATVIGKTSVFEVWQEEGAVILKTDEGKSVIAIRSGGVHEENN